MRFRQMSNPRFRGSRSARSHSVKVSMRGDSTAAMARGGKAAKFEMPAAAPTTPLALMKSRLVYFMTRVRPSYACRQAGTKFALFLQNELGTEQELPSVTSNQKYYFGVGETPAGFRTDSS